MPQVAENRSFQRAAGAAALSALALVVYGTHVLHGGMYRDDWRFWLQYTTAKPGFAGAIHAFHWTWFRPLQMLWWPASEAVLGPHPAAQTAFGLALAVMMSWLLAQVLVAVAVPAPAAYACAALVLLFPAADAVRLWPAADVASAGIALYAVGMLVSLAAFERHGRATRLGHGCGLLLYLASIALYEVATPLILTSVLVYRLRTTWRRAAARWAVDLAAAGTFLALVTSHSSSLYPRSPLREVPGRARLFAGEALTLLSRALVPAGRPARLVGIGLVAAGLAAGAARARLDPASRRPLGRWALMLLAGAAVVAAGYAPYLLSDDFQPLAAGLHNRVNVLPSVGFALIVCASAALITHGLATLSAVVRAPGASRAPSATRAPAPGRARIAHLLAGAAIVAICAGYALAVRRDVHTWDRAGALQRQTLVALRASLLRLRSHPRTVFVFGQYQFAGAGVPIFNEADDLAAALRSHLGPATPAAVYPTDRGALFYCERHDVWMNTGNVTLDDDYGNVAVARFGATAFADGRTGRVTAIGGRRACEVALRSYRAGPLLPGLS